MLDRSNLAGDLLDAMGRMFGKMKGGLGASVLIVGTLLAASTGIVGATVVTMGLMSYPVMMRAGMIRNLLLVLFVPLVRLGRLSRLRLFWCCWLIFFKVLMSRLLR